MARSADSIEQSDNGEVCLTHATLALRAVTRRIPFLYNWPSDGRKSRYLHDETNVKWTEPQVKEALEFLAELEPSTLHAQLALPAASPVEDRPIR